MTRGFVCAALSVSGLLGQAAGFDAVTVRPNKSGEGSGGVSVSSNKDGIKITIRNTSLKTLLERAYGVKDHQISGPDWLASEKYANVSSPVAAIPTESTRAPEA